MEGEKMVRKSKVGSTGRFGARYGRKAKRTVRDIEDKMHAKHICPRCDRPGVKRTHAGIWKCKKCHTHSPKLNKQPINNQKRSFCFCNNFRPIKKFVTADPKSNKKNFQLQVT